MATEYTENYDLDLYVGEDKPNLRDQYNAAMGKIDDALQGLHEGHADNVEAIASANEAIAANATEIGKLQATDSTHTSQITALQNGQTSLNTRMGTAEGDIDELQASMNGKAPVNHASSATTYGAATAANYGHVKLADTPSASGESAGIAATPKMVQDAMGKKTGWTVVASGIDLHLKELSGMTGSGMEPTGNLLVNGGLGCFIIATSDRSAPFTLRSNTIGEYKTAKIYTLPASVTPLVTYIPYGSAPNQTASQNTMHIELSGNAFYIEVNESAGIEGAYFFPVQV